MLLNARNPQEVPANIAGDTVIVGAGTVALLLATGLARARKPVVLIEAGGHVADTNRNGDTAESLGKQHNGVLISRAAGLGGTSVLWGGQLAEFEEGDLARAGAEWPLAYEELRRWYDHVYDLFGLKERQPTEYYRRVLGGETGVHPSVERFFTYWLPQPNFATLFRREILSSPMIRVVLNATVNNIGFAGARAEALWAVDDTGRRIRIGGTNFVFAAGTIANSRFFLSSQRLAAVPWRANHHIGKCFQDHLGSKVADVEIKNEQRFRGFFENGFVNRIKLQPKLRLSHKARAEVASGVCGMFAFNSGVAEHIANIKMLVRALKSGTGFSSLRTLPKDILALNRAFAPLAIRYIRDRRVLAFLDGGVELHAQAEQIPFDGSKMYLLDRAPGRDGLFRVGVDWQVDGREVGAVRKFVAEVDSYLAKQGIARLRADPLLGQSDLALLERLSDTGHQCGGLRMSSKPSEGVTDPNCRVWDTNNVYVAGASVFPSSSHANCTLTALALTARLAHRLSNQPQ